MDGRCSYDLSTILLVSALIVLSFSPVAAQAPGNEDARRPDLTTFEEYGRPVDRISLAGGGGPRWRADGKELYYYSLAGTFMTVSARGDGASLTTGTPTVLFAFRPAAAIRSILRRHAERPALSAERKCRVWRRAPLSVVQNSSEGMKQ